MADGRQTTPAVMQAWFIFLTDVEIPTVELKHRSGSNSSVRVLDEKLFQKTKLIPERPYGQNMTKDKSADVSPNCKRPSLDLGSSLFAIPGKIPQGYEVREEGREQ